MNKKSIGSIFLSSLDRFEKFYKYTNKKLNANKFSKKLESLLRGKIKVSKLIDLERLSTRAKSLLNKKVELPAWLTADTFSKGIRLVIKSKFGVTSQGSGIKSVKGEGREKASGSRNNIFKKLKNLVLSQEQNISLVVDSKTKKSPEIKKAKVFNINLSRFSKAHKKDINSKSKDERAIESKKSAQKSGLRLGLVSRLNQNFLNISRSTKLVESKKKKNTAMKIDKDSQTIGVAHYSDHLLTLARININQKNQILIRGVVEVPIPGHVVGDSLIEDTNELADIILDLTNLLNLRNSPLLVILSSSLFKVHTFFSSELKQISNTDYKVQSKSPYLPADTFVEFRNMSKKTARDKLLRTVYASRKSIESWTNMLEIINVPIIGITPAAPNIFDVLSRKLSEGVTILIDIEITCTTVLIGKKSANLTSHRLPYGSSLYISKENYELSANYFTRVLASIDLIISEYDETLPACIFVIGKGLDNIIKGDIPLPSRFRRASEIISGNYTYNPQKMEIHELASNSIDSTIDTLSCIASSCL